MFFNRQKNSVSLPLTDNMTTCVAASPVIPGLSGQRHRVTPSKDYQLMLNLHNVVFLSFTIMFPFICIWSLHSWYAASSLSSPQPTHTHAHMLCHQEDNYSRREKPRPLFCNQNDIMTAPLQGEQKGKVGLYFCAFHSHAHIMFLFHVESRALIKK